MVSSLQKKVDFLETQIKNQNLSVSRQYDFDDLRKISNKNMDEIKKALDLPKRDKKISLRERLQKLDGFLKDYSDDKKTSVDLVNEVREEW